MEYQVLVIALMALVGLEAGVAQNKHLCSTTIYGYETKVAINLETEGLTSGVRDGVLNIPRPTPKCLQADQQTGVQLTVCDVDKPPEVTLQSFTKASVHRIGSLKGNTTVKATAFCKKYNLDEVNIAFDNWQASLAAIKKHKQASGQPRGRLEH